MKKIALSLIATALLTGCATGPSQYQMYAETQKAIAQAHAVAETARYNALLEIAKNGGDGAKIAAVLSIQMGSGAGGGTAQRPSQQIVPPEDTSDKLLRWAGVVLPTVTQGLGIAANIYAANTQKQIAITQSNNAAATAASTNATFASMSNNMATSNTSIANAGFNAAVSINSSSNTGMANVVNGLSTSLNNSISKLTGSTITTTNTSNTNNTTSYVSCPAGQVLISGLCK